MFYRQYGKKVPRKQFTGIILIGLVSALLFSVIAFAHPIFSSGSNNNTKYFTDIYGNHQLLTEEILLNNQKLLDAFSRLVEAFGQFKADGPTPSGLGCGASISLLVSGIPAGGVYIDVVTNTIHIGLAQIKDEYTTPIKEMIGSEVTLKFHKTRYTYKELRDFQEKIALRTQELRQRKVPISSIGIDVVHHTLTVGLEELKPQYEEEVKKIVGKEVPVSFSIFQLQRLSRTTRYRPMIGGIKLTLRDAMDARWGATLSFSASLLNGTRGYVTTGHDWRVIPNPIHVGTEVYQPTYIWWWPSYNFVGTVTVCPPSPAHAPRYSDSSFVSTQEVSSSIYPNRVTTRWVSSLFTPHGLLIEMEGMQTGHRRATIMGFQYQVGGNFPLRDQVLAVTEPSSTHTFVEDGDSGAPIFILDPDANRVAVLGVLVGRIRENPSVVVYSPVEGIQVDLGLSWGPAP